MLVPCQMCPKSPRTSGSVDALVVGQEHRDQPGVRGALHVVLPAQRVEPGAGAAHVAAEQRERDQAARVVSAVDVLADAHAPEDHRRPGAREGAGDVADHVGLDATERGHLLRREALDVVAELEEALGEALDVLPVVELLLHDHIHDGVQQRHVGAGAKLQPVGRVALQADPARVDGDQLAAALGELLEVGRRDRMVFDRVGADHDCDLGVLDLVEGGGNRARADVLHQRRDARGVAEPGAVVDVVVLEALTDQFLEEIGLLVGALGAAEARHRLAAVVGAQLREPAGGAVERLLPARLAEMRPGIRRIDVQPLFRGVLAADERLFQPVRVHDVVEAEPALDAEPVLVRRPVHAVHPSDLVAADLVGDLAAHPAIRADRLHLAVEGGAVAALRLVEHARLHQRAGRAGLHALAAGDAGGDAHRVGEIENDLGVEAAVAHADHVVHLHLAAGADAEVAVDAGVEVDPHRHVAGVEQRHLGARPRREATGRDALRRGHVPEMARAVVRFLAGGLVGEQELDHHGARLDGALACRAHYHPLRGRTDARGGEHPLALDLDHAGAAVAVRAVAGRVLVAEMRDACALAARHLPDGLAGGGRDLAAVEREGDRLRHGRSSGPILDHRGSEGERARLRWLAGVGLGGASPHAPGAPRSAPPTRRAPAGRPASPARHAGSRDTRAHIRARSAPRRAGPARCAIQRPSTASSARATLLHCASTQARSAPPAGAADPHRP